MKVSCPNLPHPRGRLVRVRVHYIFAHQGFVTKVARPCQGRMGTLGHQPFVLEMLNIDNYCTGFRILVGMMCITMVSTIVSLNNFNFS